MDAEDFDDSSSVAIQKLCPPRELLGADCADSHVSVATGLPDTSEVRFAFEHWRLPSLVTNNLGVGEIAYEAMAGRFNENIDHRAGRTPHSGGSLRLGPSVLSGYRLVTEQKAC